MATLRSNSAIITLGAILRTIVLFFSIPILIRLLGIEQYGLWTVINAQIGLFSLADLGISSAIIYHLSIGNINPDRNEFYKILGTSLTFSMVLGVFSGITYWLLIPQILDTYSVNISKNIIFNTLTISSFIIITKVWMLSFSAIEAALDRYDIQGVIDTISNITIQLGIIVLGYLKSDIA